ncbi:hypothetical protein HDF26_000781 [Pedobacter cryoconitis]|nr:hypothetical protein [Pedobacter cryoconitis]
MRLVGTPYPDMLQTSSRGLTDTIRFLPDKACIYCALSFKKKLTTVLFLL